ncbi:sodium-coupled neutral amino acid transporter 10 [Lasius niger]|uniref:Sodium-coupled neutral amino acid transporter 10 n=1 Tax=Lasius niger TaxID=67767 RepID=A0A0J7KH89_LASNI|nr:sodium-coupled neutral amino acid transporter 10 [Lasius niger]
MLGTCVAYFVVVGDLGSQTISKMMDKAPEKIRTGLLMITGAFICLLHGFHNFIFRNIDNLFRIYTVTTTFFYLCLALKIVSESTLHIFAEDWQNSVNFWRPNGVLQCLPIFFMALFCQTQLFEIYEAISSLKKMKKIVGRALNICTLLYMCVGFFGYIAFCTQSFTGNILLSFEPDIISELMKLGFVFSIAFSFPLVIFPCGARLHSLLFRQRFIHELPISNLSESRSQCLIECIVVMGIFIMVFGTYGSLYPMEESTNATSMITNNLLDKVNPQLNIIKNLPIIRDGSDNLEHIPRANDEINKRKINKVVSAAKDVKPVLPKPKLKSVIVSIVSKKQSVVKSDKAAAGILVPKVKKEEPKFGLIKLNNLNEDWRSIYSRHLRQKIQKQLKNLRDIKKQQQKEMEKQRMSKNEVFKKSEKKINKIDKKKDISPENKIGLRENGGKVVQNKEISIKGKDNKIIWEKKQWNVANQIEINKKQQSQDKNNNVAAESSKKKLDSLQEISPNKDTEALQKKPENVPDDFYFNEEADNDRKIIEKSQDKDNNVAAESSEKKLDSLQEISPNKDTEALQKKTGNVPDDFFFVKEDIDREIPEKSLH